MEKVCDMILLIWGTVDWEGGPVDWRAWMGDIGYRGRGCVTKVGCVSIESATCIIEKGQLGSSNRVFN